MSMSLFAQQNSLSFDGTDDYVSTAFVGVSGAQPRTVEAWVNTTANCIPGSGGVQQVILDWGGTGTGARFTLNLLWANSIRLEVAGNGLSGTLAINDGVWHHVAAVYNPNVGTNQIKLYIDGQLHVQGNLTVPVNTGSSVPFQIGKRVDGINPFLGKIDEVRVWSSARTDSEIITNYNRQLCGTQPGLTAYYRFDQGTASGNNSSVTTLADQTGSHPGTLQNFNLNGSFSNWVSGATLPGATAGSATVNSCGSYTDPTGSTYTTSGTYSYLLTNAAGCDSNVSLTLTVDTVDTRVTQNGIVLSAQTATGSVQWIDCVTNIPVPGASSSVFVATSNGNYAAVVTEGSCTDTSDCITVGGIGVAEPKIQLVQVLPNPSRGVTYVKTTEPARVSLWDVRGTCLGVWHNVGGELELPEQPAGMYIVRAESASTSVQVRFIKI
jgi:hypothetical protein